MRDQISDILPWLALTAVVIVISGVLIITVHYQTGVNVQVLVVEPIAEAGLAPYVGVFTYIGVLALWSGATVSLLAAMLARHATPARALARLIAAYGLLLAWLAIDDLFLIHEELGLSLAEALGSPEDRSILEAPVFAVYGLVWLVWLIRFRQTIMQTPYLLPLLGIAALGSSVVIDLGEYVFPELAGSTPWMQTTFVAAEELAKFAGILLLASYATVTGVGLIRCAHRSF